MKKLNSTLRYITLILSIYVFWIVISAIQKPIFMLFNSTESLSIVDYISVISHGLKLDICATAYFLFIPILILIVSFFVRFNYHKVLFYYNLVLILLTSIIFAVDTLLFSYWGFRIDATVIFYLKDTKEATSSITWKDVVNFVIILIPYTIGVILLYRYTIYRYFTSYEKSSHKVLDTVAFVVLIPLFVILTRGGLSTATANVGMVYYSNNQFLNLSAINPTFSLLTSMTKSEDFSKEYQFMEQAECDDVFSLLYHSSTDSTEVVLNTQNPNVLIVLLESFSANAINGVGGEYGVVEGKEVTPNLNAIADESIVFTNCYANAMRTDRGIVSTLAGFLAQPNMSIIKYPSKTRLLPTLAKVFSASGYSTSMLYGGDINFANMRSYFVSSLYEKITDLEAFPLKYRMSKWGVEDDATFPYLLEEIKAETSGKSFFKTFLTLSSHEPFDVPMHKFTNPYLNSVAYTDSCIGAFMDQLKRLPQWKNLLVIFVADHGFAYPEGIKNYDMKKYHIPMLWTGGAVKQPMKVTRYVNQTDIPATLLTQLGKDSKDFVYSRNVFSETTEDFAFYVFSNGFGLLEKDGYIIYDLNANQIIEGTNENNREKKGKAILQKLYRDIEKR
ncbi:MAG: sulfatase-like hydrolase/transferase [Bacteroidales bacterium]|nr:sulfatase-like hydrolase/transferase [Bacteroidales bacterium]